MLDLFDVGVLLVPFEVGPAVLLLAVDFLVLFVFAVDVFAVDVFAVDVVVDLGLVLGSTVDDDVLLMLVGFVGEAVVPLVVPLLPLPIAGLGASVPVTVSVSGLKIIHTEFTANYM